MVGSRQTHDNSHASLEIYPSSVLEGEQIIVRGEGWPAYCNVRIEIDGKDVKPIRIAQGYPVSEGILPDATGVFVILLSTVSMKSDKHQITATTARQIRNKVSVKKTFVILERRQLNIDKLGLDDQKGEIEEEGLELPYWRSADFFNRRFGHIGFVPPGTRETQFRHIRLLRKKRNDKSGQPNRPERRGRGIEDNEPSVPVPGVCNWNPVGAGPAIKKRTPGSPSVAYGGRTLAIAFDPVMPSTMYIGTAVGGVWKSTDGGTTWSPKTDYNISTAIETIAIDHNNHLRIFAGTGEYNNIGGGTYYGNGILRSDDGGNTWTELASGTFERDEISNILFDTTDPTSQHMFLSNSIGVYESLDGGVNWSQLRAGSASDLVIILNAGPPATTKLIAAFRGDGLWTSTKTGATWSPWVQITDAAFPASFGVISLGQSRNNPQTIYAVFAGPTSNADIAGFVKTIDGGSTWTSVTVKLNINITPGSSPAADGHTHDVTIPASDLTSAPAAHSYTTTSAGLPAHTHTVSLTSNEIQLVAGGTRVDKTTATDSSGHSHTFRLQATGQSWYNLHIAVHPNNTNIVFFGEVRLWRNTTGGGVFEQVPVSHADQQSFAFDPVNPDNVIWAGNDGGLYRSADGGLTWSHRNRDLATLQYMSVSLHPNWESVMIGGTQDNGTHRYSGNPAWQFVAGGDGGFTAIDSTTPSRMYHGYIYNTFYRSDAAGAFGSWIYKSGGITGSVEFYPPFKLDPTDPNVCYFGNNKLWRSPNNADSWSAITAALPGNITAIAVHPTDSTTIYVSSHNPNSNERHVYRIQRTGATWNLADITVTDITGPPIPSNVYDSDIAVDTAGTVWLTVSSVLWTESTGEFTNNHVYRLPAGSSTWETRSNGLAQANPINSIVIDPDNENRLFCGGDIGVFRTEDAGANWVVWDEGLPNVPIFDLAIHGPRRLLRAATHGRGIWERPIDSSACPMVDLYMRDNILDTGRVQPSPESSQDPFDPAKTVRHWRSVDIKVDAPEPDFQTPSAIDDYVAFESDLEHRNARRNRINRFYVQVHNRGISKATNVQVRAFFANASAGLPALPADFWSSGKPFTGDPSGPDWTPIGPTRIIPELEPAEPGIVEWDWFVPDTAATHSCLLAFATCTEDALDGSGMFDADALVRNRKQVTLKNLHVDNPVPGGLQPEQVYILEMHNPQPSQSLRELVINWGNLPKDTIILLAFEKLQRNKLAVLAKPEDLKKLGIKVIRGKKKYFQEKMEYGYGEIRQFDLEHTYQISKPKDRITIVPSIRIPEDRPLLVAINVILSGQTKDESLEFDVFQQSGKRIIGGSTYLLHPRKNKGQDKND